MSATTCPVFFPNVEEFKDFSGYVQRITAEMGDNFGICKVIPPKGFFHRDYSIDSLSEAFTVKNPVQQLVSGRAGVFEVALVPQNDLTVKEFYELANNNCYDSPCMEERERQFWRSLGCPGFGSSSRHRRDHRIVDETTTVDSNTSNSTSNSTSSSNDDFNIQGTSHNPGPVGWIDPIYGADGSGSLFGNSDSSWNVDKLDTLLKLLPEMAGITNSMLYVGMWRAMFAFHIEDVNLYSINYLHTGAAKSWYAIPPRLQVRFEALANSYFPHEYHQCKEFLRHKTNIISPLRLKQAGMQIHTAVQEAGEFIITVPGGYHSGFNHGFNVAESSNFALPNWFEMGKKAQVCCCEPGNCKIDVDALEVRYIHQLRKKQELLQLSKTTVAAAVGTESHLKEAVVSKARVRCSCGVRGQLPLRLRPTSKRNSSTDNVLQSTSACLFQCVSCDMYAHKVCCELQHDCICNVCKGVLELDSIPLDEVPSVHSNSSSNSNSTNIVVPSPMLTQHNIPVIEILDDEEEEDEVPVKKKARKSTNSHSHSHKSTKIKDIKVMKEKKEQSLGKHKQERMHKHKESSLDLSSNADGKVHVYEHKHEDQSFKVAFGSIDDSSTSSTSNSSDEHGQKHRHLNINNGKLIKQSKRKQLSPVKLNIHSISSASSCSTSSSCSSTIAPIVKHTHDVASSSSIDYASVVYVVGKKNDTIRLADSRIGSIVDVLIDDPDQGRIHIKGTRKANDFWMDLSEVWLYTVVPSVQAAAPVSQIPASPKAKSIISFPSPV